MKLNGLRRGVKQLANGVSLVMLTPCAATCWLEARLSKYGEGVFAFWTHLFSMVPGAPGVFVRRAFYRLTLDSCASNFYIGFGAIVSHRQVRVEQDVYIGSYVLMGSAWLRERCLIGSRVSILSGAGLHQLGDDLRWTASDLSRLRQTDIGSDAWIGEGAVVMADVGAGSMVAAGAVVSMPVAPGVLVAGNPARFVRALRPVHEPSARVELEEAGRAALVT